MLQVAVHLLHLSLRSLVSFFVSFSRAASKNTSKAPFPLSTMDHRHVADSRVPKGFYVPLDNIELRTRYDDCSYNPLPAGDLPDRDTKYVDSYTKVASRSNEVPPGARPVYARRVAPITPLRVSLMLFDALLASTPLMFIGKQSRSLHTSAPPTNENVLQCILTASCLTVPAIFFVYPGVV